MRRVDHPVKKDKLYSVWASMKTRCSSANNPAYHHYGGRGISVASEWASFERFRTWALAAGYEPGLSLDRIDNDRGYSPSNCRWATSVEQNNNKRDNRVIEIGGRRQTLKQWTDELHRNYWAVWSRINRGWDPAEAITVPPRWERG